MSFHFLTLLFVPLPVDVILDPDLITLQECLPVETQFCIGYIFSLLNPLLEGLLDVQLLIFGVWKGSFPISAKQYLDWNS